MSGKALGGFRHVSAAAFIVASWRGHNAIRCFRRKNRFPAAVKPNAGSDEIAGKSSWTRVAA
jgi:hypothetical protein